MNPKYPVYIISKGRWESRLTSIALERMEVPYKIVVEPQEAAQYASVIDPTKILILPFSNLGQGSIPARNWVWEHSISIGAEKHWIMDDNISGFYRSWGNKRHWVASGTIFRCMEDFSNRYENLALSGPNYGMFVPDQSAGEPAFILNSRVYSCILIRNDIPYRWRGVYNEDTDLSLRVMKDGWCTVEFNAFLSQKKATMRMTGGNTELLYKLGDNKDGRLLMAKSLQEQHPDVVTIIWKFGRWQHQVDYSHFKKFNKLKRKEGIVVEKGNNEYGMELVFPSKKKPGFNFEVGELVLVSEDHLDPSLGTLEKFSVGKIEEIKSVVAPGIDAILLKISGRESWTDAAKAKKLAEAKKEANNGADQKPDHVQDKVEEHQAGA